MFSALSIVAFVAHVIAMAAQVGTQIAVGGTVPAGITLDLGFPPAKVDVAAHVAGKKVILMGLPGAFTPT